MTGMDGSPAHGATQREGCTMAATTISALRKQFPALEITGSETGRWVVLYCRSMSGVMITAERFESYWKARDGQSRSCGAHCYGVKNHCLLEIGEAPAMAGPRRMKSLGWED